MENDLDNGQPPSLPDRIFALQTQHRELDLEIARLLAFPYVDQLKVARMKKEKLRLKRAIEMLKDDLIPDLDA